MQTILPGKPQAKLQAVSTARWNGTRLVVYISGNAIVVLSGPHILLQTIYLDQCDELSAVVLDEATGNIAASSAEEVCIYKPYGGDEGALRWTLSSTLLLPQKYNQTASLSWGSEEELLVGTSSLTLYQTLGPGREIWKQDLPKPVKHTCFSPDANLIASHGWHDCNIKIWRRQSNDPEDTRFDFTYLSHPTAVTAIQWRRPPQHEHHHYEQVVDDVIFSVCADNKVRVWAASDPHSIAHMQLWAQLDMQECLQPRQLGLMKQNTARLVFFVQQDDFAKASHQALGKEGDRIEGESHARDHLAEIAKMKPDVCVVLDRFGNMSAWGLENVGYKARKESDAFNVAHLQDFHLNFKPNEKWRLDSNVSFSCFLTDDSSSSLSLVIHHFDGRISWRETQIEHIFDPSPRSDRVQLRSEWTGHRSPIRKLVRDQDGRSLLSKSDDENVLVWRRELQAEAWLLERRSSVSSGQAILRSCILNSGDFIVTLSRSEIALWDTRSSTATKLSWCPFELGYGESFLLMIPNPSEGGPRRYVAAFNANMAGSLWSCRLPLSKENKEHTSSENLLQHFCSFTIDAEDSMVYLNAVESVATNYLASRTDCTLAVRQCLVGHSSSGDIYLWDIRIHQDQRSVTFVKTAAVTTDLEDAAFVSGSCTAKVAVVDASKLSLTIWDTKSSRLEYERSFEPVDPIHDLDWTYTANSESLLAVGCRYNVVVFGQTRYNFTTIPSSWVVIREINIKDLTSHPIGDLRWLSQGNLVIGAGNQIFICSDAALMSDETVADLVLPACRRRPSGMLDVVSTLNASLPLYHSTYLAQLTLAGKIDAASSIVMALFETTKYHAPGDEMDSCLGLPLQNLYTTSDPVVSDSIKGGDGIEEQEFNEVNASTLSERISKIDLPNVTRNEQLHLAEGIEYLAATNKHRRAMDDNAKRHYLCFRERKVRSRREPQVSRTPWREIAWAMHSNSQDILVDHVVRQYQGSLGWEQAADCGIFLWLTDRNALESQLEVVARNEYTKTDEKNPTDCSLFYLALRKKNVLLGLWRMATWNREQQGTQKLLKNDFSQPRWKTAALKNAYALLGKRRFEYAAAWFLLAGNLQDVINVCLHQIGDLQLAIAVARVYEGDDSPVLRSLIKDKVLPQAATEGNRWQATWAFTMLGQHDIAIRSLIEPLHDLISLSHPVSLQARSYLCHEPALIHLYQHLRTKFLQKPNARFPVSSQAEWDFVIQTARTYDRMGCGLLALDLVRNWKFVQPSEERGTPVIDGKRERRKSGRRESSASVVATPTSPLKEKEKAKPTMFQEPEASSLLDSFGF